MDVLTASPGRPFSPAPGTQVVGTEHIGQKDQRINNLYTILCAAVP